MKQTDPVESMAYDGSLQLIWLTRLIAAEYAGRSGNRHCGAGDGAAGL